VKTVLKLFSTLVLVAGISVALAFGAKEASACATCSQPWPPEPCVLDLYCANLCVNVQGCLDGACRNLECECVE